MGSRPAEAGAGARRDDPDWFAGHAVDAAEETRQRLHAARVGPLLRFLVVVSADGDHEGAAADRTVASVLAQTWPHLRCVVAGARPAGRDGRVAALPAGRAAGDAISDAVEDFVVLLAAGDTLTPDCLHHAYRCAWRDPAIDVVYWDHDVIDGDGGPPRSPLFKPAWSPDLLLSIDYVDRARAVRRSLLLRTGGCAGGVAASDVWAANLRVTRDLPQGGVDHVERILCHLRGPGSRWAAAEEEARVALADHVRTVDDRATVGLEGGRPRVRWPVADPPPTVSVVVRTRAGRDDGPLRASLDVTEYPSYDTVTVDGDRMGDGAAGNAGAAGTRGEILVFVDGDVEIASPGWLHEIVSWLQRPGVGICGLVILDGAQRVVGGATSIGLRGFAAPLLAGMRMADGTLLGPVAATRDALAADRGCMGITRRLFDELGGFDERFAHGGGEIALGLAVARRGLRTVVSPFEPQRWTGPGTRPDAVPDADTLPAWWELQPFLIGGDPYLPSSISRVSPSVELRQPGEPSPRELVGGRLGRPLGVVRQRSDAADGLAMAGACRATADDRRAVATAHAAVRGERPVRSVTWFLPDLDSPFYGGPNTAFRIADHLAAHHGVENRFAVWGAGPADYVRSGIEAAYPRLAGAAICLYDGNVEHITLPETDAAVATLWSTAFPVARWQRALRRFYLVQDFEPMFYPAGTLYALAEESYRLGLYGICNTATLLDIYSGVYGGRGMSFLPAVDRALFHPEAAAAARDPDAPVTIFVYARPGHWRNCWEMATLALREVKRRLGAGVRIVTAGSWATDDDPEEASVMRHLGLLDVRSTGALYRTCDIGLCLTVSKHPSYLPLELMASGAAVVAFDNPHGHWLLRDGDNCLLAEQTVDGLADALERLAVDPSLRATLSARALRDIDEDHSDWDGAVCPVHRFLCDPEAAGHRTVPSSTP